MPGATPAQAGNNAKVVSRGAEGKELGISLSLNPREVVQEVYGWLLGHWAVRSLMCQAAQQAVISPLRLGFTGTLKVIRAAIPEFQHTPTEQVPFFGHG